MTSTTTPAPRVDTDDTARLFHALSDVRRLQILDTLRGGEQCVCDLQTQVGFGQSLLSFHLKTLRDAGLVTVRRSGRWAHYSLAPQTLVHAQALLGELARPTPAAPGQCCGTPQQAPTS